MRTPWAGGAILLAGILAGCGGEKPLGQVRCYLSSPSELREIRSVALVELDDPQRRGELAGQVSRALAGALQGAEGFTVRVVGKGDPLCEDLPLDRPVGLGLRDLAAIQDRLNCDAVLFGQLSDFASYPHMRMGLFLTLVDLRGGEMVWQVSHVWDSTDEDIQRRIRRFFAEVQAEEYEPSQWELALMSPRTFAKFVAWETARTLRRPPASPRAAPRGRPLRPEAAAMAARP